MKTVRVVITRTPAGKVMKLYKLFLFLFWVRVDKNGPYKDHLSFVIDADLSRLQQIHGDNLIVYDHTAHEKIMMQVRQREIAQRRETRRPDYIAVDDIGATNIGESTIILGKSNAGTVTPEIKKENVTSSVVKESENIASTPTESPISIMSDGDIGLNLGNGLSIDLADGNIGLNIGGGFSLEL
jgi:hypothetical protein